MERCLVYRRAPPALFSLDPHAWLVLELCDGRPYAGEQVCE